MFSPGTGVVSGGRTGRSIGSDFSPSVVSGTSGAPRVGSNAFTIIRTTVTDSPYGMVVGPPATAVPTSHSIGGYCGAHFV